MKTSDFDYALPPALIAQTPVEPRDSSRLLVLHRTTGVTEHRLFTDLVSLLKPGDLLVCNDSRVIAARLFGIKEGTGGKVEMLLLRKREDGAWEVLLKPGRRVRPGARILVSTGSAGDAGSEPADPIVAEVVDVTGSGGRIVRFTPAIDPLLDRIGRVPLPPYVHTPLANPERYQTIYSRVLGSVAAPTAGLHFTPELRLRLEHHGVRFAFVTLHVSLDTFRPVKEDDVQEHVMYSEICELPAATAEAIAGARARGGRVVAVGTTSVRVLETAAHLPSAEDGHLAPFVGPTRLFIYPGFSFRCIDAMVTNFHLPRSTLLMLVSAFAGREHVLQAYQDAVARRYRFYSFGDAMFIA